MALKIIRNDTLFRVEGQDFCTSFIPDTPANRKVMLVFLRLLVDSSGRPLFTHQDLASIIDSCNRQASSNHFESFVACGCDFLSYLNRKRKVNDEVVDAVLAELMLEPLAKTSELAVRVNARLMRDDISRENINAALEGISCQEIRGVIRGQLSSGEAHYKEEYLLAEMMTTFSSDSAAAAGLCLPADEGMQLSDPTAIRSLLTPDAPLSSLGNPIKWVIFIMTLYYHGLPLSLLGRWFKVHKSTILRWVISLAIELWPVVYTWINQQVKAKVVYIDVRLESGCTPAIQDKDEKWIKIQGKWHYWFVVLDNKTGLPVIASLLASKGKWACQWIGTLLKQLKKIPSFFITDGMLAYDYIAEATDARIQHILCHFHHQQSVTHYLKRNFSKEQIGERKKEMKKILQSDDKRTVKRRLQKLKEKARKLGIWNWLKETEKKLPKLLPAVGSKKIPKTNNEIERFFRAFNRFYKVRCGFFSVVSAKRELIFFMLMYLFIKQPSSGKAPIEAIMPKAKTMPLFRLVNDPINLLMDEENVNENIRMADFKANQCLQAQA